MRPSYVMACLGIALEGTSLGAGAGSHAHGEAAGKPMAPVNGGEAYSTATAGLPEAKASEVVTLDDGARYTMVAAPVKQRIAGQWVKRLAYNGSIPGPTLRVRQGAKVHITLVNKADEATTLHPHGVRVDDRNDGVPGIGQEAIVPGKSHEYTLRFPDAGVFWYHPHVRDDYAQEMGLYGNFLVAAADPKFYNPVHREVTLALDDTGVSSSTPFYKTRVTHTLMGRFGDVMLVNGVEDFRLEARAGEVLRLFITNTANARTFAFAIPRVRLKLVGSDNGTFERETWVDEVVIAPSERYIVELRAPKAGVYDIVNAKPSGPVRLAHLDVKEGKVAEIAGFDVLRQPSGTADAMKGVRKELARPVDKVLRLTMTMDHASLPMTHMSHTKPATGRESRRAIEWDDEMPQMNGASHDGNVVWKLVDDATKQENMAINWSFQKGQFAKIRLVNDPKSMHPMQHPIHFHGQRFVIAAVDGKPNDNLVWKDSVLVDSGQTLDIVMELANPGRWMGHCHIVEHIGAGMMMGFEVKG